MKPIDMAMMLRKGKHLKSREPLKPYFRRISKSRKLLGLIEKHAEDHSLVLEGRRFHVISIMAGCETYWRDWFREIIDKSDQTSLNFDGIKDIKLNISDLNRIHGKNISIGELVVSAYSFQGFGGLEKIIQDLFSLNLRDTLMESAVSAEVDGDNGPEIISTLKLGPIIKKAYSTMKQCQLIRNNTVHDAGTLFRPSSNMIRDFETNLMIFNIFASVIIQSLFDPQSEGALTIRREK